MLRPAILINENLLRYELRLTGDIKRQLKTAAVSASMLSNANFYCKLMQLWQSEFMSINKNNINNTFNMANIKTPKEAKEALLCRLLQQENGQQIIKMFLADLKEAKVFPDVKYYSRLKTELNKLLQASTEEKNSMIKELETAIRNVAKYSR